MNQLLIPPDAGPPRPELPPLADLGAEEQSWPFAKKVDLHEGHITAKSRVGQGTTFVVYLPGQ